MTASVTIAIPTRGDRPDVRKTLESALASAHGGQLELLVVWSGHDSPPIWSNALPGDPRHLPVALLGLSSARNAALEFATGDLVLLPDDDVICSAGWFDSMMSTLTGGARIVGGPVTCKWPHGRPPWMSVEMERVFGSFELGAGLHDLSPGEGLAGGNMGMWREAVLAIGGYDETLGTTGRGGGMGEENDLIDRALALGLQVTYVPEAGVDHVIEARAVTRRNYLRRMYRFGRSMAIVRNPGGASRSRKMASATKRAVKAPFVSNRMEQLGSASFELGSIRAALWPS